MNPEIAAMYGACNQYICSLTALSPFDSPPTLSFTSSSHPPGSLDPDMIGGDRFLSSDAFRDMPRVLDGLFTQPMISINTRWDRSYSFHAMPMTISPTDLDVARHSVPPPPSPQLVPPILHHPMPISPPLTATQILADMSAPSPVPSSPLISYGVTPLDTQPPMTPMTPPSRPIRLNNPVRGPGIPPTITVPIAEPYSSHEPWARMRTGDREQGYVADVSDSSVGWTPPPPPPHVRPLVDSRHNQPTPGPANIFADNYINGGRRSNQARPTNRTFVGLSRERKLICTGCSRPFTRKYDLNRHARVHTGETPYICIGCNSAYARPDKRQQHWILKGNCRIRHCMRMGEEDYGPSGRSRRKGGKKSKAAPLNPNGPRSSPSSSSPPRSSGATHRGASKV